MPQLHLAQHKLHLAAFGPDGELQGCDIHVRLSRAEVPEEVTQFLGIAEVENAR